jgi:hypothetical protein
MLNGNLDGPTGNSKPKYANTSSVMGVSATEVANTLGDGGKVAHAGWNKQTIGTGPVSTITLGSPGEGYSNGFLTFAGGGGSGANASIVVDANGVILSVSLLSGGSGYTSAPTATASNTTPAVLTVEVGGRAGRRSYETLVAMGSIVGDDTGDNAYFPGV